MNNLQLIDTLDGGSMVFDRNNYMFDQGLYTELYCTFFSTESSNWWGDTAFDTGSYAVSSKTANALKTWNSNSEKDINLIKKAIRDDLARFRSKNPDVEIENIALLLFVGNKSLQIKISVNGNSEDYNFIYQKTKESLNNLPYDKYDI